MKWTGVSEEESILGEERVKLERGVGRGVRIMGGEGQNVDNTKNFQKSTF